MLTFTCNAVSRYWCPVDKVLRHKSSSSMQSISGYTSMQSLLATQNRNRLKRRCLLRSNFKHASMSERTFCSAMMSATCETSKHASSELRNSPYPDLKYSPHRQQHDERGESSLIYSWHNHLVLLSLSIDLFPVKTLWLDPVK